MHRFLLLLCAAAAAAGLAAVGCSDSAQAPHDNPPPPGGTGTDAPVFTMSPVDPGLIRYIIPLGNLNPPSHTFPTDHMYFHLSLDTSGAVTVQAPLYAPGEMTLTSADAFEHVNAGFRDYRITFEKGTVALELTHVTALAAGIFGPTTDLSGWDLINEYTTGGETYRLYRKVFNRAIAAGDSLGTAGGNPGQWALDVGVYDSSRMSGTSANPRRWQQSRYANAVCPLDYFAPGPVADALWALVDRTGGAQDSFPCGRVLQDVPGTAYGCWFLEGVAGPYPEDNHLALVESNLQPSQEVISAGAMIATLASGAYAFVPQDTGVLNRRFEQVTANGTVFGYTPGGLSGGVVIVTMPADTSLWVEYLPAATTDPATWGFTAAHTQFSR